MNKIAFAIALSALILVIYQRLVLLRDLKAIRELNDRFEGKTDD